MNFVKAVFVWFAAAILMAGAAQATKCGKTSAGFETWKTSFSAEAKANGIKPKAISALMATSYSKGTIRPQPYTVPV